MAKTITNLRVWTRMYLDEAQQADFLDTEVDSAINFAYHDLISSVINIYEDYYFTTTPKYISTVALQQEYALDTGLISIRRVEINYDPSDANSVAVKASRMKIDDIPLNLGNTSNGGAGIFGAGYYIVGKQSAEKIGFVPIPQNAGTNNVSVWGIEAPSDLSDNNTNVDIPYPDKFAELIGLKAASYLLRKGQQEEGSAARYMADYTRGVLDMMDFLKERQADGPWMISDSVVEDIAFDSPL